LYAGAHTASLGISNAYFDRYALTSQWPAVIVAAMLIPWQRIGTRVVAIAILVVFAAFDIAATDEYFAWQTQHWNAFNDARATGATLQEIQSGAEPFQVYELAYVSDIHTRRRLGFGKALTKWAIYFGPRKGYHIVKRYPFTGWFGLHRGEVLLLEKE
jgi:hypothetical protein